jgi:hypothetical protein
LIALRSRLPNEQQHLVSREWAPFELKRQLTAPSLKVLIVKRLLTNVTTEEVPNEVTVSSESVKVTGWFSAWRSQEMRWLPSELRSWLLEKGLQLGPENLLRRTYHVYMEPIEQRLLELEASSSSASSGSDLINQKRKGKNGKDKGKEKENDNLKKQKYSKRDMEGGRERDIRSMKAAVVNDETDYELLLGKMRHFLSGFKKNPNFLQKLPVELRKDEDVQNQLSNYWLPALESYFGTLERFTYYFWKTQEGKETISALMATDDPAVAQLLQKNIDAFATARIKNWRDKVQAVYDSQSVEVLKGLFHSER